MTSSTKTAPSIRSVARALQILRLINERQGLGLQDIHVLSGLPKPTVFRILKTLKREGYLEADAIPGVFRVASKALELSSGYTDTSLLVRVAGPIALMTTRKLIKWPLAIGVLERGEIVVRYSSMPYSPLGVMNTTIGHRHDLLDSAMGHAYLIACSASEREALATYIAGTQALSMADAQSRIANILAGTRGYGVRLPALKGDSATLAVPIRYEDSVLAVLSLTTFGTSMTPAFIAKLSPQLEATAAEISAAYGFATPHIDS